MNDREFRQLLDLFPVVRSRNYCAESESSTSRLTWHDDERIEWEDATSTGVGYENSTRNITNEDSFWEKLRLTAEKKVGRVQAEKFCEAFKKAHKKLVYEELSLDTARMFIQGS